MENPQSMMPSIQSLDYLTLSNLLLIFAPFLPLRIDYEGVPAIAVCSY